MTYAPAAPEFERLPWLNDESKPATRGGTAPLVLWSIVALLLIGGASYWLGMMSSYQRSAAAPPAESASSVTIALPDPVAPRPDIEKVSPRPMPQVEPIAAPAPVKIASPRQARRAPARAERGSSPARRASAKPASASEKASGPQELWPAAQSAGAAGRAVRIGTYATRRQAKRGWRQVVRAYPGMGRLKAVVVPSTSLRNGRTYYRLQFGTTSQAHSAVLCQWMRSVAQSCVIIGRPASAG